MYWDHMTGWGWTMMVLWTMLLVLLAAGIIWALLAAGHPASTHETQPPSSKSARELLDERLAKGEIDTDEYQQRRRALEKPVTHIEPQR